MANIKKHNYKEICSELGYKFIEEHRKHVLVESSIGTKHKVGKSSLVRGCKLSIRNCVGDKSKYFVKELESRFKGITKEICFDKFVYHESLKYSKVTCKKHGDFITKPNWLLTGGNTCVSCSNEANSERLKIDTEEFIKRSLKRHGNVYDYSKSKYTGCRKSVTVTCRKHGDFNIVAYYHTSGNGCPECGKEVGGYSKSDYKRMCPKGSNVYLMYFKNGSEEFFKIGISKKVEERRVGLSKEYECEVKILEERFYEDASIAWEVEALLHREFKDNKYLPKKNFKGYSECFTNIDTGEVIKLLQCVA